MKQTITLEISRQLTLLCSLLDTTPQGVLQGFIDDVSQSLQSNGSDERWMSAEYFLRCGYGIGNFEHDQVEQMIIELNEIRRQWYNFGNEKEAQYRKHAQKLLKAWYNKWEQVKAHNQQTQPWNNF